MQVLLILVAITVVIVGIAVGILFLRHRDPGLRARGLARVGASAMGVFAIVFGVFIVGETFTDAGGVPAPWLILTWLAPLVLLSAFAWARPAWATPVLAVLTAVIALAAVWFAVDPDAWRAIENGIGPIRALATFVLGVALAALGLRRPAAAGWMLLVLGVVPVAVSSLGGAQGFSSLSVVSFMPVITGTLFLAADRMSRHAAASGAAPAGPVRQAKTT
jgi:hypothetical protein